MKVRSKNDLIRKMPLRGQRIVLRPVAVETIFEDFSKIDLCMRDPEVRERLKYFSFFAKPFNFGHQTHYFFRMIESPNDFLMVIETRLRGKDELTGETEGEFIGTVGLHDIDWVNESLRLGIIIFNKNYWQKGFGKETIDLILRFVLEELGMNKVYLTARADNESAIRVYEKLGFQREGVMRKEYKVKKGEYIDLLRMSILRSEWIGKRIYEALAD